MSVSIAENTACEPASRPLTGAAATCDRIIREQIPNLFRLYLNPYVAQACYCLTRLAATSAPGIAGGDDLQVFLANSGDEALSGAIKLARYVAHRERRPATGLLIGPCASFEHFASTTLPGGARIDYIPGLRSLTDPVGVAEDLREQRLPGFVAIHRETLIGDAALPLRRSLERLSPAVRPTVILLCTPADLFQNPRELRKDACAAEIMVFDESLVRREVPFGAFVAGARYFRHWNRRKMSTFHSTTFQPNTISSLHLLECLRSTYPDFMREHDAELSRIARDPRECLRVIHDYYSRALADLIRITGFADFGVQADGHYIRLGKRSIFDAVAGVACSVRGHNPPTYSAELQGIDEVETCHEELSGRLQALTGLPHVSPAVSGAAAVEQALKLGLVAQHPRNYVLALRGGFGGKTLFALTGTWKAALKSGLDPLYPHVVYVDPFTPDACEQVRQAFRELPIGVVQLELVQAVGGVRSVPPVVLDCLLEMRDRHHCLLFVDEVQTGMFRTGPFVRSRELGLAPDLLTIGKGTSDMMFPFALTLHSGEVQQKLDQVRCRLPELLQRRSGFEFGYRTVVNTLRWAESVGIEFQVERRGKQLAEGLRRRLRHCAAVREVRSFGLLVGIELSAHRAGSRWLRKLLPRLYLLSMLRHPDFPLLVGFCQYEPHVLKLTPPLTVTVEEIDRLTGTMFDSLSMPLAKVAWHGVRHLAGSQAVHGKPNCR